ncbi:MAG: D-sedoheptulose 7-phosphate isomerase [Deltaproteobacteria bacterium]|nr:D-sedoheptulose 7-phosphate isomerase [Deltaproteobacteria bacterium]
MENDLIKSALLEAKTLLDDFIVPENIEKTAVFAREVFETIQKGNKVITCGNGGSMCDAMHFAEELTGRFRADRPAYPAIAISDPSHITCTGNDYGLEFIFSRYIEALGNEGDLLIGISTSGNSLNIYNAVRAAKEKGLKTSALLGKGGGTIAQIADNSIVVPGQTSDRIQEIHIKIIHSTIEAVERLLADN